MGIHDGNTENGAGDGVTIDPFNLRANYGPLNYDRTNIFNAAYNIALPGIQNGDRFLRGVANGWMFSGDIQLQSEPPLQGLTSGSMNIQWQSSSDGATASNAYLLGTNAPILVPYLTCDPRSGGGRYFNVNCFQTPSVMGKNGPAVWQYIKGPAYFGSDLGLYKTFSISERQSMQCRVSAFNFLNHPLPQFGVGNDVNLAMSCVSSASGKGCDGGGQNTNANTNGNVEYKSPNCNRYMELALKYYF